MDFIDEHENELGNAIRKASRSPDDPGDNFWVVDYFCEMCRCEIEYKDARLLT